MSSYKTPPIFWPTAIGRSFVEPARLEQQPKFSNLVLYHSSSSFFFCVLFCSDLTFSCWDKPMFNVDDELSITLNDKFRAKVTNYFLPSNSSLSLDTLLLSLIMSMLLMDEKKWSESGMVQSKWNEDIETLKIENGQLYR